MKKNTFHIVFHYLGGNIAGLRELCFSTVARNALISGFPNWIFATFSFKFTQEFIGWSVSLICTPRVHRIVFMRSIFFEKHTFPNVFQISGGNFSGFWQIFPSTVLRTALVSRFSDRICAFFRTLRRVSLAGLSELHPTRPQDYFYGKHLL